MRRFKFWFRVSQRKQIGFCLIYSCIFLLWICASLHFVQKPFSQFSIESLIQSWHLNSSKIPIVLTQQKWKQYSKAVLKKWNSKGPVLSAPEKLGDLGIPVILTNNSQKHLAQYKKSLHQFNVVVSDLISVNRSLPDYRNTKCLSVKYDTLLPKASIIIIFHNEARSTILRTIHSVINRSPDELLHEIILVDDNSDIEDLLKPLDIYVKENLAVSTIILRLDQREGLIRARLRGAKFSSGSILIFLDAHIEVTEGWIEPILEAIAHDRTRVILPVIDDIDDENLSYIKNTKDTIRGGFDWKLMHSWIEPKYYVERKSEIDPIPSPTMIGCAFAIDREFFFTTGSYDDQMMIWGGENIEMSIRIWRCGGSLLILPCSRIGHMYRQTTPHSVPGGFKAKMNTVARNNGRLAEVWLDDYKNFYYFMNPGSVGLKLGDLSDRKQLIKDLQCHDFQWFLDHIYPDSSFPTSHLYFGQIENEESGYCLDALGGKSTQLVVRLCHGLGGFQSFLLTKEGQLRSSTNCVQGSSNKSIVFLDSCSFDEFSQWKITNQKKLKLVGLNQCLAYKGVSNKTRSKSILRYLSDLTKESILSSPPTPVLVPCTEEIGTKWKLKQSTMKR